MAHDLFGVPVKDDGQIQPSPGTDLDLGHVNAPEVVGMIRVRLGTNGAAPGLKTCLRRHDQLLLFHQAIDAFLVNSDTLTVFEIRPDAAVTPEGMVGLDILD